jgi:ribonuclease-3
LKIEKINIVISSIASNDNLGRKGFELGLERYIQVNRAQRGQVSNRTMATTLEAIIGAIYIDSGFNYSVLSDVMARLGLGWPQ